MTENEKITTLFTTRVRQMILQYNKMKKENEELYGMVDDLETQVKSLKEQLAQTTTWRLQRQKLPSC